MNGLSLEISISRPVKILIGVFFGLLLVFGIGMPMVNTQRAMREEIQSARIEYLKALSLARDYQSLKQGKGKKSVVLNERLFPYVERITSRLKLARRIDYVRPENRTDGEGRTVEVVHVAFKGITLDEFVRFLYEIEVQKKEIYVKTISIKKDDKKNLNTQMTLQKVG